MPNEEAAVGMCITILIRARNQRMNLVQRLISILLYGSHAQKQVSHGINKINHLEPQKVYTLPLHIS